MLNPVALRPATWEDCRRIWEWRNEEATRQASFNTGEVSYEEHERWFSRKLVDPSTRIFIVADPQGGELGYLRFDIKDNEAEISVTIDRNKRRSGYGSAVIKSGSDYLLTTEPIQRVRAHIKRHNRASIAAFRRAGYALRGYKEIAEAEACEMIYEG